MTSLCLFRIQLAPNRLGYGAFGNKMQGSCCSRLFVYVDWLDRVLMVVGSVVVALSWAPLVMSPMTVDFPSQKPSSHFSFDFGFFSDKPTIPSSKLKLKKTRRRHVKARANLGLNPSEPCLVDPNQAMDYVLGLSHGFVFEESVAKLNNPNLNVEMTQSNVSCSNLNSDYMESNKNDEFGMFLSGGSMAAIGKSCLNLENPLAVGGLLNGLVFGTKELQALDSICLLSLPEMLKSDHAH